MIKKEQTKDDKIRENIRENNDNWNDWKVQLYWKNINWADQNEQDTRNNTLCSLNNKFYIEDGNKSCHYVGYSKLKPIYRGVLFKSKEFSAALISSIGHNTVATKK